MQELKQGTPLQGGKYIIKKKLGQGGFGITYLAEQVSLGRDVAIKEFFMKDNCVRNDVSREVSVPTTGSAVQVEQYRKKFLKEARMLAGFVHPNIVNVIDVFEENGTVYYSMPYYDGGSLKDLVLSRGRLPEEEAMRYVQKIASALRYMHQEKHVCHFDVKPDNILFDINGNPALIDFGISKNYDDKGNETSSTPVGMSEGYAPIEQYQQMVNEFSPASDVYALGATLFFMLTGSKPPTAISLVQGEELTFDEGISHSLQNLIKRTMSVAIRSRPQEVDDFLDYPIASAREGDEKTHTVRDNSSMIHDQTVIPERADVSDQTVISGQTNNSDQTIIPDQITVQPKASASNIEHTASDNSESKSRLHRNVHGDNNQHKKDNRKKKERIIFGICAILTLVMLSIFYNSIGDSSHNDAKNLEWARDSIIQQAIDDMVYVKGSTFVMGPDPNYKDDIDVQAKPAHQVTLSDYYISKYEVTQFLWQVVMGDNPSHVKDTPNKPVDNVSWNDCQEFIKKLNKLTNRSFRLPTEAEWEFAARGGDQSHNYLYSGGNVIWQIGWCIGNSGGYTQPVGKMTPNELGLYDMSGNVHEWCHDWYDSYSKGAQTNPTGPSFGSNRVYRGGSCRTDVECCRVWYRGSWNPNNKSIYLGLRLAQSKNN